MDSCYDLTPKVVLKGNAVDFKLRPLYEPNPAAMQSSLILKIRSLNNFRDIREIPVTSDPSGEFQFRLNPCEYGEYTVSLDFPERPDKPLIAAAFYAVGRDLLNLRPYKGDLHLHTYYSDGRESPAYMVAHARSLGLDFAAITDHRYYESSLEAMERAEQFNMDILLFPGEEVNYYLGLGHIISLNADRSIEDMVLGMSCTTDELTHRIAAEVREDLRKLELMPGTDRSLFGYYYGIVKMIHQAGGFAVTAHPCWTSGGTYDLMRKTYEQVLDSRIFDAVEVFGDQGFEKNMLSLARISQYCAENSKAPLLGSSDAHKAHRHSMGQIWTIVFADTLSRKGVLQAIKEGRTVPCVTSGTGDDTVATGDTELVEYGYFLLREFFPRHDEICAALGGMYKAALRSGERPEGTEKLKTELLSYYDECFASENAVSAQ